MKQKKSVDKELFFNVGVAGDKQDFLLAGLFYEYEGTDTEVTRVVGCEDGDDWFHLDDVDGIVAAILSLRRGGRLHTLSITRTGDVATNAGDDRSDDSIPIDPGYLFDAVIAGDTVFVCGSQYQVWRSDGAGWARAADGAEVNSRAGARHALYGLSARSETDVYAVGTKGHIVHFDGRRWAALDSPTNVTLHRVLALEGTELVTVGRAGQAFIGSPSSGWTSLAIAGMEDNFWGLCRFSGKIYCSTASTLYRLDGQELKPVAAPKGPKRYSQLFANESYLWVTTGTDQIFRFDGKSWKELVCPENE